MINLEQFIFPSQDIIDAIKDLQLHYEVMHQDMVKLFNKKGNKGSYKGSLNEYSLLKHMEDFYEQNGKPWEYFYKAISLVNEDNYTTEFDTALINKMNQEDLNFLLDVIKRGPLAKNKIDNWFKKFGKKKDDILEVCQEAFIPKIGTDWQFEVLKHAKLRDDNNGSVGLYNDILEIPDPNSMIYYLKNKGKEINNCLILTYVRNPKKDWKSSFYLFLIYKGNLYTIDNSERRLNLDNAAGSRNPARAMERLYEHVYLPVFLVYEENQEKLNPKKLPVEKGSNVKKVMSFKELCKDSPVYYYWLEMFMYRIVDHIENNNIEQGYISNECQLLLESEQKAEPIPGNSFRDDSTSGAGSYLLDVYKTKASALVLKEENLPLVIGTEKYISEIIEYKRRQLLADQMQIKMNRDYKRNHEKVNQWIENFASTVDCQKFLEKALINEEYEYSHYPTFCDKKDLGLQKTKIVSWSTYPGYKNENRFIIGGPAYDYSGYGPAQKTKCRVCNKYEWKVDCEVEFKDYRQILKFFDIKKEDLHEKIVSHLHQQSQLYVGNSILDDTDPLDELEIKWFYNYSQVCVEMHLLICKQCLRKQQTIFKRKGIKTEKIKISERWQ